jgi:small subunit ribosomal protein S6
MYILRPDLGEERVQQSIEKYENILREQGATAIESQHRGKRRLAYEIQRHREGIYIQLNYEGEGKEVAPLERAMRISEEVIRYLTVKQEKPEASSETDTTETPGETPAEAAS